MQGVHLVSVDQSDSADCTDFFFFLAITFRNKPSKTNFCQVVGVCLIGVGLIQWQQNQALLKKLFVKEFIVEYIFEQNF